MIALLESADLVMAATDHPLPRAAAYRFVASSGAVLGSMQEIRSARRSLGRLVSRHPGFGPARLQLIDGDGRAVMEVEKDRLRPLGRLRVRVALADGTAVGSVDGRVTFRQVAIALRDPAGELLGELRGGSGGQYELVGPGGDAMGVLARQLSSRAPMPPGVWRSYQISLRPSAGVAVRGLALATLAALDMRLL